MIPMYAVLPLFFINRLFYRVRASNVIVTYIFRHLAPEYFTQGVVDEKTDVFAFGVFLLEIISGKKPVDGSHQSLHSWVMPKN